MQKLDEYFNAFSYEIAGKQPERFYHLMFHSIFLVMGMPAISEDKGLIGRADEVVIAGNHIWVFELKVDRSAEEALRQIEEKGYADKYSYLRTPEMKIHRIGINFSSETRKITEWLSNT